MIFVKLSPQHNNDRLIESSMFFCVFFFIQRKNTREKRKELN